MTTAYVAHPIDQAQPERGDVDLTRIRFALTKAGVNQYWPRPAWNLPTPGVSTEAVAAVNETAQRHCDVTFAWLPADVPTLGVPAEIERALQWGQPVALVVSPVLLDSVQVAEWRREGAWVFETKEIEQVAEDLHRIEPSRAVGLDVKTEGGQLPTRGYEGDAGWDLYATQGGRIAPGAYVELATDIRVGLPPGTWGLLVGRSSTAKKGLLVNQAVIDNGYTGPMFFGVTNVSPNPVTVTAGDRLAQLIPMPLLAAGMPIRKVDSLPETDRGERGFGSTGN